MFFAAALALAACSGDASGPFDGPQSAEDELSDEILGQAGLDIDAASTRFVGTHGDTDYYAAKPQGETVSVCVLTVGSASDVVSFCSTELPILVAVDGQSLAFSSTAPEAGGWEQLEEYLWMRE